MIKNPMNIFNLGIVKGVRYPEKQIQQNGIDLTVQTIRKLETNGGILDNEARILPELSRDVFSDINVSKNTVYLEPGVYSVDFNEECNIPNGLCAMIVQRSTINRCGAMIHSGVYDAGFKNRIGAVLYVHHGITLTKDTRLAQIVFYEAEEGSLYNGMYQWV